MTNNRFVYFQDAFVVRTSRQYKVVLEEEEFTIFLKEKAVEAISEKAEQDENLVAILLAYVECVRRNTIANNKFPAAIQDTVMIESFSAILRVFSIEEIVEKVKAMKWHEIVNVLNAESPIEEIENI